MKNIFRLFLLLLLVSAFLAACARTDAKPLPSATPFIGGKNGLAVSFIQGAPPPYITDAGSFPFGVNVKLENLGEADIAPQDAYVEVTGVNPRDFGLPGQAAFKKNIPERLTGARKTFEGKVVPGGQSVVEYPELRYVPDIHGNTFLTFRADACYNYKTFASSRICVKSRLLEELTREEVCRVNEAKPVFNSGAPIHVTDLTEAPIGSSKIQVTFTISRVGDIRDRFFAVNAREGCKDIVTNPDRYLVFVNVQSDINGRKAKCSGLQNPVPEGNAGFVKLFDGAPRIVSCTFDLAGVEGTFEDLLDIELSYKYLQSIEQPLEIRDVSVQ